ncbi:ATP-dependent RNA helicase HrpA [Entomospira culicis]|uniref:ATP-dependent RNA helicase HrpA n=1 Tax=Entomospira culicis TaxID=2719989 RepID=A0A968GHF3_9SPIO|nr:ATP-dependent RNA helicase HrpA [Entomospira culicis]NIZ19687.1 ATP-dependent RNA helicase HrpA [Entomospira culicis]NIZ69901.1 ATP-dependent RNA helicase HrpA [Entomospira culicis]WDI37006.1 ATP-dependent RNA helicase HrpA [Entomospira culicis]WDI38635.1 ATP-dependent RNA helicase HrpA [Entomospira culicis]
MKASQKQHIRQWSIERQKERWAKRPALLYPDNLPILQIKEEILAQLKTHQVLIIAAETGSGKSTQLPKILLEAGMGKHGKIACIQPRRIATTSIAKRIAYELKENLGQSVGYRIRFDDKSHPQTFIQVMTDGMLLSEIHHDHHLLEYDAVIVDEAHERSLNIDLLLGLLKKILVHRPHFKILIASATIDTERFSTFFHQAPILLAKGRHYVVEIRYQEPTHKEEDILEQALRALESIALESTSDDVLIFLPTEDFIKNFIELAKKASSKEKRTFLPLYARLSQSEQQLIFEHVEGRKVIVATNIAETSITLPNIRYVIDAGLARINQYSAQSRIQNLPIVPISQASANQRAGRCGRVSNGICIRLYSEEDFHSRAPHTEPEIKRANLAETILRMMAMHIKEPEAFEFIDQPQQRLFNEGFKTLFELQAIPSLKKSQRKLTPLGRAMSHLPLDPRLARMLIAADEEGALEEVTIIAAALSVMDLRSVPEDKREVAKAIHQTFHQSASDLLWYLQLYDKAIERKVISQNQLKRFCQEQYLHPMRVNEWLSLTEQIRNLMQERGYKPSAVGKERPWQGATKERFPIGYIAIHRAILTGYLSQIGVYQPAEEKQTYKKNQKDRPKKQAHYLDMRMQEFSLFPTSSLLSQGWQWVFATKMWRTSRLFAREVASIDPQWLEDLAKHLIQKRASLPVYSEKSQEVVCTETHYLYSYPIAQYPNRSYLAYNPEQATLLFVTQALTQPEMITTLLEEELFAFLRHNVALQESLATSQAKLRRETILLDKEAIVQFYLPKMKGIASVVALRKKLQQDLAWEASLYLKESDLAIDPDLLAELQAYPSQVIVEEQAIVMEYRFAPNQPTDGVTAILTPKQVAELTDMDALLWQPMGLFVEKITAMIKALPKPSRIKLHPTAQSVKTIHQSMPKNGNLFTQLQHFCQEAFHVQISKELWQEAYGKIEDRLKMHYAVRHTPNEEDDLARAEELGSLKKLSFSQAKAQDFAQLAKRWHQENLQTWPTHHPTIPPVIAVTNSAGEVYGQAYPALFYHDNTEQISLKLFEDRPSAENAHLAGIEALVLKLLKSELSALKKNFQLKERHPHLGYWASYKEANRLFENYTRMQYVRLGAIRTQQAFEALDSATARQALWQDVAQDFTAFTTSLELYHEAREKLSRAKSKGNSLPDLERLEQNLAFLAGKSAWLWMSQAKVRRLPQLLKIWHLRFDRALANLPKDREKALPFAPYHQKIHHYSTINPSHIQIELLKQLSHILYEVELKQLLPESKNLLFSKKELEEIAIML